MSQTLEDILDGRPTAYSESMRETHVPLESSQRLAAGLMVVGLDDNEIADLLDIEVADIDRVLDCELEVTREAAAKVELRFGKPWSLFLYDLTPESDRDNEWHARRRMFYPKAPEPVSAE
ncbi:MAG: hypothetical protein AAF743_11430 [Planctomycetota bacterium]